MKTFLSNSCISLKSSAERNHVAGSKIQGIEAADKKNVPRDHNVRNDFLLLHFAQCVRAQTNSVVVITNDEYLMYECKERMIFACSYWYFSWFMTKYCDPASAKPRVPSDICAEYAAAKATEEEGVVDDTTSTQEVEDSEPTEAADPMDSTESESKHLDAGIAVVPDDASAEQCGNVVEEDFIALE